MSKVVLVSRLLLGLCFFVFGLNGLLMVINGAGFIPAPPMTEPMTTIMAGFMATGYLLPLVKIMEVVAGLLLLSGFYVNAAIVLLGPIIVNIVGIHLFAERSGAPVAIVILVLFIILIKSRWESFRPLLAR